MNRKIKKALSILGYGAIVGIIIYQLVTVVYRVIAISVQYPNKYSALVPLIPVALSAFIGALFSIAINILFRRFGRSKIYKAIYYLLFVPVISGVIVALLLLGNQLANTSNALMMLIFVVIAIFIIAFGIDYYFSKEYKKLNAQLKKAQQQ